MCRRHCTHIGKAERPIGIYEEKAKKQKWWTACIHLNLLLTIKGPAIKKYDTDWHLVERLKRISSLFLQRKISPKYICQSYGLFCESWTKNNEETIDAFELWYWQSVLRELWTAKKTSKWILDQIEHLNSNANLRQTN